jgi:GT2 family glycosyltransferase
MIDRQQPQASTMKSYLLDTIIPWWKSDPRFAAVTRCDALLRNIETIAEPGRFVSLTIAGFPWIHTTSAMIRRAAAMAVGLFDERLKRTEDIDLWLKLERAGGFVYIDDVLATYDITGREGGSGERYSSYHSSRQHTRYLEARYHLQLLDRIERSCPLTADQIKLLKHRRISHHRRCAVEALRERRWSGVLHAIRCIGDRSERKMLLRDIRAIPRRFRDSLRSRHRHSKT